MLEQEFLCQKQLTCNTATHCDCVLQERDTRRFITTATGRRCACSATDRGRLTEAATATVLKGLRVLKLKAFAAKRRVPFDLKRMRGILAGNIHPSWLRLSRVASNIGCKEEDGGPFLSAKSIPACKFLSSESFITVCCPARRWRRAASLL